MFCSKCGSEIPEVSSFCNKCGASIRNDLTENEEAKFNDSDIPEDDNAFSHAKGALSDSPLFLRIKDFAINKNNRFKVYITLAIILVIVIVFAQYNNPVSKFKRSIANNNSTKATQIYSEKIRGDSDKEAKVKTYLEDRSADIYTSFKNQQITYDVAETEMSAIAKTPLIRNVINNYNAKLNILNNSRISYVKAEAFLEKDDYFNAIKEYKNVIKDDSDYEKAQKKIQAYKDKYKNEMLKTCDIHINEKEYDKALSILVEAIEILPNDGYILAQKETCEELKIQNLIDTQEVAVIGVNEYTNIINTNYIAVTVNNRSQKTVKRYEIGFMGFDKNGYPVKVGLGSPTFVGKGYTEQNIMPGETKHSGGGWYLDNHDVKTLIACIIEVEYYDGEGWRNPYYEYWEQKYREKPLN